MIRPSIRSPRPQDCARMAELAGELGYPTGAGELRRRLAAMRDRRRYAVFVAEAPGEGVVGWINVYLFRAIEVETFAEISGLVVAEGSRGLGVGRLLIAAAERWARRRGSRVLSVRANVTRRRAHQFYAREGFVHVKTQKALLKDLSA